MVVPLNTASLTDRYGVVVVAVTVSVLPLWMGPGTPWTSGSVVVKAGVMVTSSGVCWPWVFGSAEKLSDVTVYVPVVFAMVSTWPVVASVVVGGTVVGSVKTRLVAPLFAVAPMVMSPAGLASKYTAVDPGLASPLAVSKVIPPSTPLPAATAWQVSSDGAAAPTAWAPPKAARPANGSAKAPNTASFFLIFTLFPLPPRCRGT